MCACLPSYISCHCAVLQDEELSKLPLPEDIIAKAVGHEQGLAGGEEVWKTLTNSNLEKMKDNLSVPFAHIVVP
jgi:hypothetical protein